MREVDRALALYEQAVSVAQGQDQEPLLHAPDPQFFAELDQAQARTQTEAVLLGSRPDQGLEVLRRGGALEAHFPEVMALVGFGEGGRKHKDVWEHTKRVVKQSPSRRIVRWAALLHDVGKVPTRKTEPSGQVTFHGHAEVGARMAGRVLKRLAFEKSDAQRIRQLVLFHLRPSQYQQSWTDSAVRRFGKEVGELLGDLLDLSRADMTTKYAEKRKRGHSLIDDLEQRVTAIQEEDAKEPLLPKGLGSDIIKHFRIQPGPRIGVLRDAVEQAVEQGDLPRRAEPGVYLEWLSAHIDKI